MNTALIVAAGSGTRYGADRPKQFLSLGGKPIILYSLEIFQGCPAVDEIVLVLSTEGRREFAGLMSGSGFSKLVSIVTGGSTRADSVKNGLDVIAPHADGVVAVHDGARPLVNSDEIQRVIEKAAETGAACLAADISDTVKRIENGMVVETIDRSKLRRALTPQAFRYGILKRAFEATPIDEAVTDECYLVERLGVPIACVEGSSRNIKITRPGDLDLAEMYLESDENM